MLIKTTTKGQFEWHVGSPMLDPHDVIEVQADGGELNYVRGMFADIPFCNGKLVVRWFGEMARFIVGNL